MERWDLYDKDGNKLGKTMPKGGEVPAGCYRLVVHLGFYNKSGELLICQRKEDKNLFPNYWEISVSGSVISGETSEEAIKREALEEVGVDISEERLVPHLTLYSPRTVHSIYLLQRELKLSDLTLQPEEVKDAKWASRSQVLEMIERGEFIPYHNGLTNLLYDMMEHGRGMRKNQI